MNSGNTRPDGLNENVKTAMSCRGPGPARKNEEVPGIPEVGREAEEEDARIFLREKVKRAELTQLVGDI